LTIFSSCTFSETAWCTSFDFFSSFSCIFWFSSELAWNLNWHLSTSLSYSRSLFLYSSTYLVKLKNRSFLSTFRESTSLLSWVASCVESCARLLAWSRSRLSCLIRSRSLLSSHLDYIALFSRRSSLISDLSLSLVSYTSFSDSNLNESNYVRRISNCLFDS